MVKKRRGRKGPRREAESPHPRGRENPPWRYQPDEQPVKRKHHWNRPHAGFCHRRGFLVGKCPSDMSLAEAQKLLDGGVRVPWPAEHEKPWPKEIWAIKDGVPYRAVPTEPGRSYHGFPALRKDFERLPSWVQAELWDRARQAGCERELKQWLKLH